MTDTAFGWIAPTSAFSPNGIPAIDSELSIKTWTIPIQNPTPLLRMLSRLFLGKQIWEKMEKKYREPIGMWVAGTGLLVTAAGWLWLMGGVGSGMSFGGREIVNLQQILLAQTFTQLGYALLIAGSVTLGFERFIKFAEGEDRNK